MFCDSLRRRAIVYLILFIGTRVSTRPPEISDGAFLLTTVVTPDLVEAAGVAGAATGAGSGAFGAACGTGAETGVALAGLESALGAAGVGAAEAPGAADGSISTNLAPTATVSPSLA